MFASEYVFQIADTPGVCLHLFQWTSDPGYDVQLIFFISIIKQTKRDSLLTIV